MSGRTSAGRHRVRCVDGSGGEQEREWTFFAQSLDPLVRDLLAREDPWEAYSFAIRVGPLMIDTSPSGSFTLPHAGDVYVTWMELTDLFETGKTPIGDAYATLRVFAERWLDRPAAADGAFIEQWSSDASDAIDRLFRRDGNWRIDPE